MQTRPNCSNEHCHYARLVTVPEGTELEPCRLHRQRSSPDPWVLTFLLVYVAGLVGIALLVTRFGFGEPRPSARSNHDPCSKAR